MLLRSQEPTVFTEALTSFCATTFWTRARSGPAHAESGSGVRRGEKKRLKDKSPRPFPERQFAFPLLIFLAGPSGVPGCGSDHAPCRTPGFTVTVLLLTALFLLCLPL